MRINVVTPLKKNSFGWSIAPINILKIVNPNLEMVYPITSAPRKAATGFIMKFSRSST